jgi:hypothetical protein
MERIFRDTDSIIRPTPRRRASSRTSVRGPGELLRLQRAAGNAAVSGLLQRYTEAPASGSLPARRISASAEYLIAINSPGTLWRKSGSSGPQPDRCKRNGEARSFAGVWYEPWIPAERFAEDCLQAAEQILAGEDWEPRRLNSRVQGTATPFGHTVEENKNRARAFRDANPEGRNEKARATRGQAFVIVEVGAKKRYPYHAAAVVATDGGDRITVEVSAGETHADLNKRETLGIFDMYSVEIPEQSFHARYAKPTQPDGYSSPITMVIESR